MVGQHKILKWLAFAFAIILAAATGLFLFSDNARHVVRLAALDAVGEIASARMESAAEGNSSVAAEFIAIPVKARTISDNIFQATGVSNANLITTSAGDVLFDTGLSTQSARQYKALREVIPDLELSHIIVSHAHADHSGGVKLWQREGVLIIAHAEFSEEQRYLTALQPYFWHRNRTLFPFMPQEPPTNPLLAYGGVKPSITVARGRPYRFRQGGVTFDLFALSGAEGADNLVLWLPERKILFSGDFFGPLFPQFPNIFTMRGEKIRKPVEYIQSLEEIIALEPELIIPSHKNVISGKVKIMTGLKKIHSAISYVHDTTIAGMNAGKTVEQLMTEITLPPELMLTQEHGKVAWAVKSIWEYYATWFHFDRTTALYPVPMSDVYADITDLAGASALVEKAQAYVEQNQPLRALHLVDIVLENRDMDKSALEIRKKALEILRERAINGHKNSYEIYWLDYRIRDTHEKLSR